MRRALRLAALTILFAAACSRPEPAPAPAPTEPWPAQQSAALSRSQRVRCRVERGSVVQFESRTKTAHLVGSLRSLRGELDVDLLNLPATRGVVEADLTSVRIVGEDGDDRQASARAQSWLDLGPSRPQAERERLRFARFTIESVTAASAPTAHEGRRRAQAPEATDAGADGGHAAPSSGETRTVTLDTVGKLRVHGFEVALPVRLSVDFSYGARATAGAVPVAIAIATERSFPVSLDAHDVRPRDDRGSLIASDAKLLGTEVAREVEVNVTLVTSVTEHR